MRSLEPVAREAAGIPPLLVATTPQISPTSVPDASRPRSVVADLWALARGKEPLLRRTDRGRLAFLILASLIPYLFVGQTWLLFAWAIGCVRAGGFVAVPDLTGVASVPGRLVAFHLLSLGVACLPGSVQLRAAAVGALAIGLALRLIDLPSVVVLGIVATGFALLFRSRLPRWSMLLAIVVAAPLLRALGHVASWPALDRPGLTIGLIVVLWYACYHVTGDRALSWPRYIGFVGTRLFVENPVFTIEEFDATAPDRRERARLAGVRALAIALLCRSLATALAAGLAASGWDETRGVTLLGASYLFYLSLSLELVFQYNLALGVLRLIGLPIRDNFGLWFLARTPNEHWQRWNLLFREWLVTFVFYPLMRARRPLLICVMATLITSGLLHGLAAASGGGYRWFDALTTLGYWVINGLLIYSVLAVPRRFPRLVARLRLAESPVWWVLGWTMTSAIYSILAVLCRHVDGWSDALDYLQRLVVRGA